MLAVAVCLMISGCGVTANPSASKEGGASQTPGPAALTITTSALASGVSGTAYSSSLGASGGTAPYLWSLSSGQLPAGIALDAASGALAGTPSASGTYSLTLKVTDASEPPEVASAAFKLQVAAAPTSGSGGAGSGSGSGASNGTAEAYGSGINADALSNIRIGPEGLQASYRFLATHTGTVADMRVYLITVTTKPGYEGGDGGKLLVQLQTDDGTANHNPSGTTLASYEIMKPQVGAADAIAFPKVVFSPAPKLQAGTMYHVVFSNLDASPTVNYVSVDDLWMKNPVNPMQPMFNNANFSVLARSTGTPWSVVDSNTPIFEVDYADGTTLGCGYMEVWAGVPEPISATSAVRETFTVSGGNKSETQVSVRLARIAGAGPLTVKLEQTDGTVIEKGTIPATQIPLSTSVTSPTYVWAIYKFSETETLFSGQGYNLELDAPAGTIYQAYPVRKGTSVGFASTYFPDGYAEFNLGLGWAGWTQWGVTNRTDSDLQFYFSTAP